MYDLFFSIAFVNSEVHGSKHDMYVEASFFPSWTEYFYNFDFVLFTTNPKMVVVFAIFYFG